MSDIEYEIEMMMLCANHSEEQQTAEMLELLNRETQKRREEDDAQKARAFEAAEKKAERYARLMATRAARQTSQKQHRRRKWLAVRRACVSLLAVAALFGVEQLVHLPHVLTLTGMVLLLVYCTYLLIAQVIPEAVWYARHNMRA